MSQDTIFLVCQKWEESEAGWGTRPDGFSLHKTDEDRIKYIEDYWNRQPKEVQAEYSRPDGTPYLVKPSELTAEQLERMEDSRSYPLGSKFWGSAPGSGGTDGWRKMK